MKRTKQFIMILLFIVITATVLSAQNAPIDFETGGYGAGWTWAVFENDTNPPLEIVPNPDVSGVNTSETVAQFTALVNGQPWAGCESLHGSDIGLFNLNNTNFIIKIMVYKSVISDVGIKFVKPDSWSLGEIKIANTVVNEWEEITFDFTAQITDGYDQIVIFPDFDLSGRTQDNICYFDNITFGDGSSNTENFNIVTSPYILDGNYPNPFNPETTLSFSMKQAGNVSLSIYNVKGRLVETLVEGNKTPGFYQQTWNADNIASGIYFYRLSVDGREVDTKRMTLLK